MPIQSTFNIEDPASWRRIEDLLDQALEVPAGDLGQWLRDLGRIDAPASRCLEELLREHHQLDAEGFLSNPDPVVEHTRESAGTLVGRTVGGVYTVERLLGQGGMGEVWLARRSDGRFEAHFAIKFLDHSIRHHGLLRRFRQEGQVLARLVHPNIARLVDAGEMDAGRPYLVLEFVDGERIDRFCERHVLDIPARLSLFLEVVLAVSHAHAQLIVHRDLKPSNVLVTRERTVKLLDFGVAKLLDDDADATDTRVEDVVLTPEYAAPEQLLGEFPSTATDVYQLGMLLYVLLVGRHPLQLSGTRAQRIKAALEGSIPRASELAGSPHRSQLRGDLDAILEMTLQPDPRHRYQTAKGLAEDIARYLNNEPIIARRTTTLYRARKLYQRHRLVVSAGAIVLALLCGSLMFALAQDRAAVAERDRAATMASRNAAVTDFLGTLIADAAQSRTPVSISDLLKRSETLALSDRSGNASNRAAVLGLIADEYQGLGATARSASLFDAALEVLGDSADDDLRAQLTCERQFLANTAAAAQVIDGVLASRKLEPSVAVICLASRSYLANNTGDAPGGLRYALTSLDYARAVPGRIDIQVQALSSVAYSYYLQGSFSEAQRYFAQAVKLYEDSGRGAGAYARVLKSDLASVYVEGGMLRDALRLFDEVLRDVADSDPDSPPAATMVYNRAQTLRSIGRFQEAKDGLESALQLAKAQQDRALIMQSILGLAWVSEAMGRLDDADQYLQQASPMLTPDTPLYAARSKEVLCLRARLQFDRRNFLQASALYSQALSGNDKSAFNAVLGMADSQLALGNAATAGQYAQQAVTWAQFVQGGARFSYRTGLAMWSLGRAQGQLGQIEEAKTSVALAVTNLSNTVDDDHPVLRSAREWMAQTR
jgi:serine/threonine protein kinase